ncbi:MAG: type II secretion system protein [Candidatus Woesebacteria bacterium]|nr:type II secretion system protein [Candidatus Woesebacteria bacterium]
MNQRKRYNKAFTLIEMLVVISLIGILAALALVSFGGAQKQARDTTRKSDLKQYQTSIEGYANRNNGNYPISGSTVISSGTVCTALAIGTCPADPKDPVLQYKYIGDGIGYVIWSSLENKTGTFWVVCSNGKTGEYVSTSAPSSITCPI